MSRISARFAACKSQGRTALITYLVAGDPAPGCSPELMRALVAGGADMIELGIPFSDPEADGSDIQAAAQRALAQGATLDAVFSAVRDFRSQDQDTPVLLMGYLNSILSRGPENFASAAAAAGVDGAIIVNLPPEEGTRVKSAFAAQGLEIIYLIAPTTSSERVRFIAEESGSFVYCVALKGTTGSADLDIAEARKGLQRARSLVSKPLAVGFGIRDAATARALADEADAVVVGSAVTRKIGELATQGAVLPGALTDLARELRRGLDGQV